MNSSTAKPSDMTPNTVSWRLPSGRLMANSTTPIASNAGGAISNALGGTVVGSTSSGS